MSGIGSTKQPVSDVLVKMSGGFVVLALLIGGICAMAQLTGGMIFGIILGGIGLLLGFTGIVMNQFGR